MWMDGEIPAMAKPHGFSSSSVRGQARAKPESAGLGAGFWFHLWSNGDVLGYFRGDTIWTKKPVPLQLFYMITYV